MEKAKSKNKKNEKIEIKVELPSKRKKFQSTTPNLSIPTTNSKEIAYAEEQNSK